MQVADAKASSTCLRIMCWQGAPRDEAARAGAEFGAEDGELDAVEEQGKFKAGQTGQPFWPQDQLVSDMAIHLALMVEQLGLSASPNDWTQVRFSWHDTHCSVQPISEVVIAYHTADMHALSGPHFGKLSRDAMSDRPASVLENNQIALI